jgi:hypothetical protein
LVDVSTVANHNSIDNSCLFIDGINDPIVALTEARKVRFASELNRS